ncbi:MAG: hypothetical protein ACYCYM_02795 [Saccharofermentanales bacterium]
MKKLAVTLVAIIMVMSLSVLSFAQGGLGSGMREQKKAERQEAFAAKMEEIAAIRSDVAARKQELQTKKEEFEAFRTDLGELRETAIAAMKANNGLRAEGARLHSELRGSLESLKLEGTALSQEVIDGLNEYKDQIAVLREELQSTKDQILDIRRKNGEFRSTKAYDSLITSFNEIIAIQQLRNDCLVEINGILQQMLSLLVSEG